MSTIEEVLSNTEDVTLYDSLKNRPCSDCRPDAWAFDATKPEGEEKQPNIDKSADYDKLRLNELFRLRRG